MSYGGGGFVASQNEGGGSPKKAPVSSPIRPVTVAQINSASQAHPDAPYVVDGHDLVNISIVACVRSVIPSKSFIVYLIEDGTGQIECRKWLSPEEVETEEDTGLQNAYIRANGTIKSFGGKAHIHCSSMRVIEDHNEILYHAVETVSVHLRLTRGEMAAGGAPRPAKGAANPYAAGEATGGNIDAYAAFTGLPKRILENIASLGELPEEGVNINTIARALGVSVEKIKAECDQLTDNGALYTTTDEDHFLLTT